MLSGGEENGARKLLRIMAADDVVSLAKTVMKNQIAISSVGEAIDAIIMYSTNGVDLLKRRKIKRELLLQYLYKEKVAITPSSGKVQLAKRVLEHWGTNNVDILELMEVEDEYLHNNENMVGGLSGTNQSSDGSFPPNISCSNQQPNLLQDLPQQMLPTANGDSWLSEFMNFEHNIQTTPEDQLMGQEFTKWFYRMLNACNPHGEPSDTPFGVEHFFPTCELKVALVNTNHFEVHQGAEAVCEKFLNLMQTELLIFCPNIDANGIMSIGTSHGLKIFLVCGTLHKEGNTVGVFAEQFGLVRNPDRQFNWNIRFTNLKLIAGAPLQPPTLQYPGTPLAAHISH